MNAILAGASGFTGGHLARELASRRDAQVTALVRKTTQALERPVKQVVCDFARLDALAPVLEADAVFCALGSTIVKAGSREAFRQVDYDAVMAVGRYGRRCGASQFLLVSSVGASPKSRNFYLRVKGEAERDLATLGYRALHIFRPSMLLGVRAEKRIGETIGIPLIKAIGWALGGSLAKYRGIEAIAVARAMVRAATQASNDGVRTYHYREISALVVGGA